MNKDILVITLIGVIGLYSVAGLYILVDAQDYKISDNVTHLKFISSDNLDTLSNQVNTFIVNKSFDSSYFTITKTEFFSYNGTYTILIEYKDINEITPDKIIDAQNRSTLEQSITESPK